MSGVARAHARECERRSRGRVIARAAKAIADAYLFRR